MPSVTAGAASQRRAICDDVLDETKSILQNIADQIGNRNAKLSSPFFELFVYIFRYSRVDTLCFLFLSSIVYHTLYHKRDTNVIECDTPVKRSP